MKFCKRCGHANEQNANFCEKCGIDTRDSCSDKEELRRKIGVAPAYSPPPKGKKNNAKIAFIVSGITFFWIAVIFIALFAIGVIPGGKTVSTVENESGSGHYVTRCQTIIITDGNPTTVNEILGNSHRERECKNVWVRD